jgi:hypothetical protein
MPLQLLNTSIYAIMVNTKPYTANCTQIHTPYPCMDIGKKDKKKNYDLVDSRPASRNRIHYIRTSLLRCASSYPNERRRRRPTEAAVVGARRATAGDSGRRGRRLDPSLPTPRGCRREAGADASASSICRRAAEQGPRPARLPETRHPGSPQPPLGSPLPNYGSAPSSAGASGGA